MKQRFNLNIPKNSEKARSPGDEVSEIENVLKKFPINIKSFQ